MSFISKISVHYGNPQPPKTILDLNGGSADINKGFRGEYVYLLAERTTDPNFACNRLAVVIQDKEDPLRKNLAKDTGPDFRYLLSFSNPGDHEKVFDVQLFRSSESIESPPTGFAGMTGDINKGRKGDFLYLMWTTSQSVNLYISRIDVVYGSMSSEEPEGAVTEINNNKDNINAGFGGSYVWLVPIFTSNAKAALADLSILVQDKSDGRYKDLAKGAGGDYCYCVPIYDVVHLRKVTNVRLLRCNSAISTPPIGYQSISTDINRGRGGSYLYLIWQEAIPPP